MGTNCDVKPSMMWCSRAQAALPVTTCVIILCAFQTIGCSMSKPPTEVLSIAELTLRTATEARADEFAPMDLQRAREKLEASKKAVANGKYDEARKSSRSLPKQKPMPRLPGWPRMGFGSAAMRSGRKSRAP